MARKQAHAVGALDGDVRRTSVEVISPGHARAREKKTLSDGEKSEEKERGAREGRKRLETAPKQTRIYTTHIHSYTNTLFWHNSYSSSIIANSRESLASIGWGHRATRTSASKRGGSVPASEARRTSRPSPGEEKIGRMVESLMSSHRASIGPRPDPSATKAAPSARGTAASGLCLGRKRRRAEKNASGKPPSNPRGWPDNYEAKDLAERPHRMILLNADQPAWFCNNFVRTSKVRRSDD